MANFMEFIRYGLPGYLFLASLVFALIRRQVLPTDYKFYNDFGTIMGAALLVIGPLFGFIIHQIYFVYFDLKESYTKLTRGCLKMLFDYYLNSHQEFANTKNERRQLGNACYVAWKFLMTGMDESVKVSTIFLTRLTSLRNYSHAFGGIVTASLLSLGVYIILLWGQGPLGDSVSYFFVAIHAFVLLLFVYKRHELSSRISELENGIMKLRVTEFSSFLERLVEQKTTFEAIGAKCFNENSPALLQESQVTGDVPPKGSPKTKLPTSPVGSRSSR